MRTKGLLPTIGRGFVFIAAILAMTGKSKPEVIEYSFAKGSFVTIDGTTNVKDFSCLSKELFSGMRAEVYKDKLNTTLYFKNALLNIDVSSLDCGYSGINKDLFRALKSSRYPYITVQVEEVSHTSNSSFMLSRRTELKVKALLTLAGLTQPEEIQLSGIKTGDNQFHLVGQHLLSMRHFGIKPPTALFGMIKVRDSIVVRFDLDVRARIIP